MEVIYHCQINLDLVNLATFEDFLLCASLVTSLAPITKKLKFGKKIWFFIHFSTLRIFYVIRTTSKEGGREVCIFLLGTQPLLKEKRAKIIATPGALDVWGICRLGHLSCLRVFTRKIRVFTPKIRVFTPKIRVFGSIGLYFGGRWRRSDCGIFMAGFVPLNRLIN